MSHGTIIIGGGITGAFVAYFLTKNNYQAVLIDPQRDDCLASHINPGGLNPLHGPGIPGDMEKFFMYGFEQHMQNWPHISQLSGVDFNGRIIYRFFIALTEKEKSLLLHHQTLYEKNPHFSSCWLDKKELQKKCIGISKEAIGGLYTYGNATVSSKKYHHAVMKAAIAQGLKLITATVESIQKSDNTITLDNGDVLPYDNLVLCCGSSKNLDRYIAYKNPVKPIKGDLLIARLKEGELNYDITHGVTGIYQYDDGKYFLGGTSEDIGMDTSLRNSAKEKVFQGCSRLLPGKSFIVEKHLSALRPATPDGRPLLGRVANNIFMATGSGSKGMLLSAALGGSIMMMIEGRSFHMIDHLSPLREPLIKSRF